MRVSLFGTDANRKFGEVNTTVKPGSRPVGTTVFGRVTTQPGTHTLTISVDATQPGAPNPVHLSEEVPVMVQYERKKKQGENKEEGEAFLLHPFLSASRSVNPTVRPSPG